MLRYFAVTGVFILATIMPASSQDSTAIANRKILIVYFSRTGNTEALAQSIHAKVGGDLIKLIPAVPYSDVYQETIDRHIQERDSGAYPELASSIDNLGTYDVVFLGYPNWGSTMPRLLFTFLNDSRLVGKTIIPFCTHGGGGMGRSIEDIRLQRPDTTVLTGLGVSGRTVQQSEVAVERWLHSNGFIQ